MPLQLDLVKGGGAAKLLYNVKSSHHTADIQAAKQSVLLFFISGFIKPRPGLLGFGGTDRSMNLLSVLGGSREDVVGGLEENRGSAEKVVPRIVRLKTG